MGHAGRGRASRAHAALRAHNSWAKAPPAAAQSRRAGSADRCFHTLPEDRRPAYVAGVSEAAGPGATLLLHGFRRPPKAAPMHAGVTTDEVQQRFSGAGWELANAERMPPETLGIAVRRTADRFDLWRYQLRRV